MLPTDAQLRKVGLAWYRETVDINSPEFIQRCTQVTETTNAQGERVVGTSLYDPYCIRHILGKDRTYVLTNEDRLKLWEWARVNFPKTNPRITEAELMPWLAVLWDKLGIVGKTIGSLIPGATVDADGKDWQDIQRDLQGVGDMLSFLTDPKNILALAAIVVGGGLFLLGFLRLIQ